MRRQYVRVDASESRASNHTKPRMKFAFPLNYFHVAKLLHFVSAPDKYCTLHLPHTTVLFWQGSPNTWIHKIVFFQGGMKYDFVVVPNINQIMWQAEIYISFAAKVHSKSITQIFSKNNVQVPGTV